MAQARAIRLKEGKVNVEKVFLSKRLVILILLAAGLALAYVHIKYEQTKFGYEISANNKKKEEILRENLILQAEFMKLKSPEKIENIARELGFRFPTQEDVIYIKENTIVGERR